jgi:hypothetical protein
MVPSTEVITKFGVHPVPDVVQGGEQAPSNSPDLGAVLLQQISPPRLLSYHAELCSGAGGRSAGNASLLLTHRTMLPSGHT